MIKLLCFTFILLLQGPGVVPIFEHCPNGSLRHDNSCYIFARDMASWAEAAMYCQTYGARLASIETAAEQNFITHQMKIVQGVQTDPGHYYWLGGTDAVSEGEWYWSGMVEQVQYTNWAPGEPNDGTSTHPVQNCLAIYSESGLWDDGWCETRHNFICEIDLQDGSEIVGK